MSRWFTDKSEPRDSTRESTRPTRLAGTRFSELDRVGPTRLDSTQHYLRASLVVMGHDAQGEAYIIACPAGHAELGRTPEPRRGVGRRRERWARIRVRRETSLNRVERAPDM